ncbi:hypothetical protein ACEQ8H_003378 [Pleosporales sp. CAS-2024a]
MITNWGPNHGPATPGALLCAATSATQRTLSTLDNKLTPWQKYLLLGDPSSNSAHTWNLKPLQKATKSLAAANTARLNQTLYLSLVIHGFFWLLRGIIFHSSFTRRSLLSYLVLASPQLLMQLAFERQSRPTLAADGAIQRAGEDLDANGLTEYMWDVIYWTYGVVFLVALLGDVAWWLWAVVPLYSAYAAWTTYTGMRRGFSDAAGVPQPGAPTTTTSKRQAKMDKRGGQKVQYR